MKCYNINTKQFLSCQMHIYIFYIHTLERKNDWGWGLEFIENIIVFALLIFDQYAFALCSIYMSMYTDLCNLTLDEILQNELIKFCYDSALYFSIINSIVTKTFHIKCLINRKIFRNLMCFVIILVSSDINRETCQSYY